MAKAASTEKSTQPGMGIQSQRTGTHTHPRRFLEGLSRTPASLARGAGRRFAARGRLLGCPLAWRRLRQSGLGDIPEAQPLRDAYRLSVLTACSARAKVGGGSIDPSLSGS
jgi:hypothetical protein